MRSSSLFLHSTLMLARISPSSPLRRQSSTLLEPVSVVDGIVKILVICRRRSLQKPRIEGIGPRGKSRQYSARENRRGQMGKQVSFCNTTREVRVRGSTSRWSRSSLRNSKDGDHPLFGQRKVCIAKFAARVEESQRKLSSWSGSAASCVTKTPACHSFHAPVGSFHLGIPGCQNGFLFGSGLEMHEVSGVGLGIVHGSRPRRAATDIGEALLVMRSKSCLKRAIRCSNHSYCGVILGT